ncbi:MAG: hypothetical protein U0Z44_16365 [Kouleothrix sp.]
MPISTVRAQWPVVDQPIGHAEQAAIELGQRHQQRLTIALA